MRRSPDVLFLIIWVTLSLLTYLAGAKYVSLMLPWYVLAFAAVNIATFCLYGLDKLLAAAQTIRIPERALHLTAFLFGSPGALVAMNVFRHKTRKTSFQLVLAFLVLLQVLVVLGVFYFYQEVAGD